jgi:hypothetical protein
MQTVCSMTKQTTTIIATSNDDCDEECTVLVVPLSTIRRLCDSSSHNFKSDARGILLNCNVRHAVIVSNVIINSVF